MLVPPKNQQGPAGVGDRVFLTRVSFLLGKKKICLGSLCFKVCCSPLRNVLGNRGKVLGAQDGISVLVGLHEAPTSLLHLSFKVSGSF